MKLLKDTERVQVLFYYFNSPLIIVKKIFLSQPIARHPNGDFCVLQCVRDQAGASLVSQTVKNLPAMQKT